MDERSFEDYDVEELERFLMEAAEEDERSNVALESLLAMPLESPMDVAGPSKPRTSAASCTFVPRSNEASESLPSSWDVAGPSKPRASAASCTFVPRSNDTLESLPSSSWDVAGPSKPKASAASCTFVPRSTDASSMDAAEPSKPKLTIAGSNFLQDGFATNIDPAADGTLTSKKASAVHTGDTDSSDEDDATKYRKYHEYGRQINMMLRQYDEEQEDKQISKLIDQVLRSAGDDEGPEPRVPSQAEKEPVVVETVLPSTVKRPVASAGDSIPSVFQDSVHTDPVFGMRIVHPLISSQSLKDRMEGKVAVPMARLARFIESGNLSQDWVVGAVVVNKSPTRKTSKGTSFAIWRISDLHGDIKSASLFLFSSAYEDLWKTAEGTVLAILNPQVLKDKQDRSVEATLSIDRASKVVVLGKSRDLGTCRSKKKNGDRCTNIVNLGACEHCIYHVKQEYNKASSRGGIISSTGGRGLNDLRNKVLGKSEVFYGGQSFAAIKATKSAAQISKDNMRMMTLSEYYQSPFQGTDQAAGRSSNSPASLPSYRQQQQTKIKATESAARLEWNVEQRKKDIERLKALGGPVETPPKPAPVAKPSPVAKQLPVAKPSLVAKPTPAITATTSVSTPSSSRLSLPFDFSKSVPRLSAGSFEIEFKPTMKKAMQSRMRAVEVLKKKPLEKSNPNFIKHRGTESGRKRALEELINNADTPEGNANKRRKAEEEEQLKRIVEARSSHAGLIEMRHREFQEQYFKGMEQKEAMEEKMLNTFKMACKAVICMRCKYMAFSAADRCKQEQHEIRVRDAEKRFFKCGECGNRTVTLHRIPTYSCRNCQSSRWERCAMLKEKKGMQIGRPLSIRGDEEKFLGSLSASSSLNLLVPDE